VVSGKMEEHGEEGHGRENQGVISGINEGRCYMGT